MSFIPKNILKKFSGFSGWGVILGVIFIVIALAIILRHFTKQNESFAMYIAEFFAAINRKYVNFKVGYIKSCLEAQTLLNRNASLTIDQKRELNNKISGLRDIINASDQYLSQMTDQQLNDLKVVFDGIKSGTTYQSINDNIDKALATLLNDRNFKIGFYKVGFNKNSLDAQTNINRLSTLSNDQKRELFLKLNDIRNIIKASDDLITAMTIDELNELRRLFENIRLATDYNTAKINIDDTLSMFLNGGQQS